MAANGLIESGAMQIWKVEFEKDLGTVQFFKNSGPKLEGLYSSSLEALETRIVQADDYAAKVDAIVSKYKATIAADDGRRAEMRHHLVERRGR